MPVLLYVSKVGTGCGALLCEPVTFTVAFAYLVFSGLARTCRAGAGLAQLHGKQKIRIITNTNVQWIDIRVLLTRKRGNKANRVLISALVISSASEMRYDGDICPHCAFKQETEEEEEDI